MADINMRILLSAVGASGVSSAISSISSAFGRGGLGGALLATGTAATAAAIGLGVTAVKAAADFQAGLTTLSTGAGESQKNLKMVGDGILNLATQTGTSTKQLTDGMYMIESAGFHGKAGLDVLKNAAEGAKVGNADLGTVADATTTIMTDFASKNVTASQAVNTLIATVSNGKTTMGALSGSLSQILPTASAAGISLTDTSAAMATMTGEGIPAANAATYLRQTIIGLQAPSKQTITALASIGLKSKDVSNEMKVSLPGALQMITDHLKKKFPEGSAEYVNALKNISGGSKTMQGMLDLTGQHLNTFKNNVTNIAGAVKQGGSSITGWSQVQQNFNFKMAQGKEVIETLMIKIGQQLLPVVTKLLGQIIPLISRFGDWLIKSGALQNGITALVNGIKTLVSVGSNVVNFFQRNQAAMIALKVILIAVAGAILATMVVAFYAWAVAAGAAAIATLAATWPILLIGAIVALVVVGIILAIQHWGQIAHWLQGIWAAVMSWLTGVWSGFSSWFMGILHSIGAFFVSIWNSILNGLRTAWNAIVNVVRVGAALLLAVILGPIFAIGAAFVWLYNHNYYFKALCDAIVNFFKGAIAWLQSAWSNVVSFLTGLWNTLSSTASAVWNAISSAIQAAVQAVWSWLQGIWSNAISWISGEWNQLSGLAQTAWNAVTSVFSNAWGGISSALSGLWNNIAGWFSNLAGQALTWGANVVNMIAQGITNAAGSVTNAISGVANNIKQFLGFHSPAEKGPASDADKWMPNFMGMMASGIVNGLPQLQRATNLAASTLARSLDPSTLADQLSFTGAPLAIYSGTRAPVATRAVKQEAATQKREERKAAAAEKRQVHIDIRDIKHELHIHTPDKKLDHAQIQEIVDQAMRQFGQHMGEQIRAQFGSI